MTFDLASENKTEGVIAQYDWLLSLNQLIISQYCNFRFNNFLVQDLRKSEHFWKNAEWSRANPSYGYDHEILVKYHPTQSLGWVTLEGELEAAPLIE